MYYFQTIITKKSKLLVIFIAMMLFSVLYASEERSVVKRVSDPTLVWGACPEFMGEGCNIAVIHGDPSQSNSDILFKVTGDFHIPNHWHTSAERMILLTGKMTVTYEGEESQVLLPGRYAYGPAKKPHTAYCHKGEPCILFIAFEAPIDAFAIKE